MYFARDALLSDLDRYALPDPSGVKTIMVADVITGEYCIGRHDMRNPVKNGGSEPYNSAVDSLTDPSIFVIFVDAGAYPAYIIKYKK